MIFSKALLMKKHVHTYLRVKRYLKIMTSPTSSSPSILYSNRCNEIVIRREVLFITL